MQCSIVITNFNYCGYVKEAIESALLVSDDVIVIDDGSTDGSQELLLRDYNHFGQRRINLKLIANNGVAHARNLGIKLAKYDYVICLDADDTLNPEIKNISLNADIIAIGMQHFGDKNHEYLPPENLNLDSFKEFNQIPVSCPFSKRIWEKVGGFDQSLSGLEDYDFWVKCLKAGASICTTRKPLLNYRIHSRGRNIEATRNYKTLHAEIWKN
tara:strand:+ start:1504 stop:2142 length:639 start_codon:yes stop_codon:yes gene_type:complete